MGANGIAAEVEFIMASLFPYWVDYRGYEITECLFP